MMFVKLAVRNVRRSLRDYGVYLLTLTFGVCLFYTFNSLEGQSAMAALGGKENPRVQVLLAVMDVFSVFVAVVLGCLILYANRFLIRRRKRELGIYLLLGLSQGQVSRLLFLETGLVGALALALGLAAGIAASQGLSALTLSLFSMDLSMLHLAVSGKAILKTLLYFLIIFLIVIIFSGVQVSRAQLIDLIHAERKSEQFRFVSLRRSVLLLGGGAACLGAAYAILLYFGMVIAVAKLSICVPMLALGTVGTLLLFRALPGFVLWLVRRRPELYFKDLNLFTLRQWLSRVHTACLSQTVICILLLLAIGVTASSVGLSSTLEGAVKEQAPFDLTVQNQSGDSELVEFDALLSDAGALELLKERYDVLFYYNDPEITGVAEASSALRLSDYNRLQTHNGGRTYAGNLPWLPEHWNESLVTGNLGLSFVVVSDDIAEQLPVRRQVWCADYAGDVQETEGALRQLLRPLGQRLLLRVESRLDIYWEVMGSKALALFLGLYLGLTFLLASAAVLALQQMSQAADNTARYAVLRRLGVEDRLVGRSAVQQVALAFLLPLALALVHSAVGLKAANDFISTAGQVDSAHSIGVTALVLAAVYGGYFLITALACRRLSKSP